MKVYVGVVILAGLAVVAIASLFWTYQPDRYARSEEPQCLFKDSLVCKPAEPRPAEPISCPGDELEQAWDCEEKIAFWYLSQGSQMLPYNWFMHLKEKGSQTFFRVALENKYRYIAAPEWAKSARWNPDGLPIGITKDIDSRTGREYVGLTCSACHTAELLVDGKYRLIEGGSARANFMGMLKGLVDALEEVRDNEAKFTEFLRDTCPQQTCSAEELRNDLRFEIGNLRRRLDKNLAITDAGFGRADAFGMLFNHLTDSDSGNLPSDAPVSYPFLWRTHQLDRVQWSASASNRGDGRLLRNVTEALGAFVRYSRGSTFVPDVLGYASSVKLGNLKVLEALLGKLRPPKYPSATDQELSNKGGQLYHRYCATCHQQLSRNELPNVATQLHKAGTDPLTAQRFLEHADQIVRAEDTSGNVFGSPLPARVTLAITAARVLRARTPLISMLHVEYWTDLRDDLVGYAQLLVKGDIRYKSVPLNGVWATAPFLHNGSVPNLTELLSADRAERREPFCLGSNKFDSVNVGVDTEDCDPADKLDPALPGNRNTGHMWGVYLSREDKRALIEFVKYL